LGNKKQKKVIQNRVALLAGRLRVGKSRKVRARRKNIILITLKGFSQK